MTLVVYKLKKINSLLLSPHQKLWQIRYTKSGGKVSNLVDHPSSSTLYLFLPPDPLLVDERVRMRKKEPLSKVYHKNGKDAELINPVWQSPSPYDWKGLINHILSFLQNSHGKVRKGKTDKGFQSILIQSVERKRKDQI